jgi:thioredoxin reductase (NADPH)
LQIRRGNSPGREGVRGEFSDGKRVGYLAGTRLVARTAICATGIEYHCLGLPNEDRFRGAGVYYGAGASEATLYFNEHIIIVGGGNSARQAAMHFSNVARLVTLVVRGDSLKSTLSSYLLDRIRSAPNIEVLTNTEVTALDGEECLAAITLTNRKTGEQKTLQTRWPFICIGGAPHTSWAVEAGIIRDTGGYLVKEPDLLELDAGKAPNGWPLDRNPYYLETNVPGFSQPVTSDMAL